MRGKRGAAGACHAPGCGGRTLARDVIDDSLGAIVGPGVRDNVSNDSVFLSDFPFLGRPL